MKKIAFLFALLLPFAALAINMPKQDLIAEDNQAVNRNYERLVTAFSQLSPDKIAAIYTDDACYISERHDREIIIGLPAITAVYDRFFTKIRNKNANIALDFRVVNRKHQGKLITDVGYYVIRFFPASDTGEPIREYAGKFAMVSEKQANGEWRLSLDSSNTADPKFYFAATPTSSLYYGTSFSQSHNKP